MKVTESCPTLCDPKDCNHQALLSMGLPRQEYWSGLLFPYPGDLPDPGIELRSPALQANALTSEPPQITLHGEQVNKHNSGRNSYFNLYKSLNSVLLPVNGDSNDRFI